MYKIILYPSRLRFACLLILTCQIFAVSASSQIQVSNIAFETKHVLVVYEYSYYATSQQGSIYFDDTALTTYDFRTYSTSPTIKDTVDGQVISAVGYNMIQRAKPTCTFAIDTINKKLRYLTSSFLIKQFSPPPLDTTFYWDSNEGHFEIVDVPYVISNDGDTLNAFLDASALKKILFSISNFTEASTPHTGLYMNRAYIKSIPDSAYFSITINGKFPLSIQKQLEYSETSVTLDYSDKMLYVSNNPSQRVSCVDILGVRHQLPLISTNQTSAQYSMKSLSSGMYFISAGKSVYKFMIGK